MRKRIKATRWPERETITDESQGVKLAMIVEFVRRTTRYVGANAMRFGAHVGRVEALQEPPLIQPCSWKRVFSCAPICWEIFWTRPSIVLLPLSSPYDFIPVVRMKPAGL
jgi:hypothetical protein